jgi:hypothetical protein
VEKKDRDAVSAALLEVQDIAKRAEAARTRLIALLRGDSRNSPPEALMMPVKGGKQAIMPEWLDTWYREFHPDYVDEVIHGLIGWAQDNPAGRKKDARRFIGNNLRGVDRDTKERRYLIWRRLHPEKFVAATGDLSAYERKHGGEA